MVTPFPLASTPHVGRADERLAAAQLGAAADAAIAAALQTSAPDATTRDLFATAGRLVWQTLRTERDEADRGQVVRWFEAAIRDLNLHAVEIFDMPAALQVAPPLAYVPLLI